ncbi:pheromone A receptor-domain-containing protein [Corynascus novoguineensis]|uniref:Pheromone A receptor-domain-containing protein n=1 Tax=Corynascus novoguineensis TaxID=1126955 RepID=A0AAN7HGD3_9PEZI|nr:pheromone A receptor-domain-containing protein [Corynascus novoguineensis]
MASPNGTMSPNRWAQYGFTTSADERIGTGGSYTSLALHVNLFFRVFLGLVSIFITWVPARLLWRSGEFGGTTICVMLLILNLITVINALIWRDDNVERWWAGQGWCDFLTYTFFAMHTAFNICMFEIMRGLASKVALNRAVKPTRSERRRQRVVSAMVIFTIPAIQVMLTYFATFGRYNVSTLVGCSAVYYPNWVYLVFYVLPTPVFAVAAAYMAALAFYRYRKIERSTRDISNSQGDIAAARQDRVRKKLYFMTLFCIIMVLPLTMVLLLVNIVDGAPWDLPYDFDALHFGPDPFNIYFISFTTSDRMSFPALNIAFIGEVSGIAVFIPFGTTPEALNMYREMLLALGLDYVFPKLKNEYVPCFRRISGFRYSWCSIARSLRGKSLLGTKSSTSTRKDSLLPITEEVVLASRDGRGDSSSMTQQHHPRDITMSNIDNSFPYPQKTVTTASSNHHNPWPNQSTTELNAIRGQVETGPSALTIQQTNSTFSTPYARSALKFHIPHQSQQDCLAAATESSSPSSSSHSRLQDEGVQNSSASIPQTISQAAMTTNTTTITAMPVAKVDTRVWADNGGGDDTIDSDDHDYRYSHHNLESSLGDNNRGMRPGKKRKRTKREGKRADLGEGVVLIETSITRRSAELANGRRRKEEKVIIKDKVWHGPQML